MSRFFYGSVCTSEISIGEQHITQNNNLNSTSADGLQSWENSSCTKI